MQNKKTIFISLASIVVVGGWIAYQWFANSNQAAPGTVPLNSQAISGPSNANSQSGSGSGSGNPPGTVSPGTGTSQGAYKNGQYTGQAVDAFYGTVQVQATVQQGKLADVQFLQYPNSAGHSLEVSNYALPILKSEAIRAQSARVDVVSGATQTSEAFAQSLQSALAQAQ